MEDHFYCIRQGGEVFYADGSSIEHKYLLTINEKVRVPTLFETYRKMKITKIDYDEGSATAEDKFCISFLEWKDNRGWISDNLIDKKVFVKVKFVPD